MFEFSNMGTRIREIREPVLKDGKVEVVVTGKEDLQDYINSFADSCDIEYLVQRAVNGDETALKQRTAAYGDFTKFPKTYADCLNAVIQGTNLFNSLPVEIRNKFDNDVNTFITQMDEPDFMVKIGFESESEVDEEVNKE